MTCSECGADLDRSEKGPTCFTCAMRDLPSGIFQEPAPKPAPDPVNHPPHYTKHPSGVECITVTEHMNFCRGNAVKYIWRAGDKGDELEDLKKSRWYIDREIARLEKAR